MNKIIAAFQGKTHFIIWVCILLGSGGFVFSTLMNNFGGLWTYLFFLGLMSGVQAFRSISEDKVPK